MSISPFSFVIIILIGGLFIKNIHKPIEIHIKYLFVISAFLTIFTNVGYFLRIGETQIGYPFVVSSLCLLFCVVYLFLNGRVDRKLMIGGLIFWGAVLISIFGAIYFPYRGGLLQSIEMWDSYVLNEVRLTDNPIFTFDLSMFMAILRMPIIFAVISRIFDKRDFDNAMTWLTRVLNIVIIYGIFEAVAKFILQVNLTESFLNPVFGEATATFAGTTRLQGLFKEPSQYAQGLLYMGILTLFNIRTTRGARKRFYAHCRLVAILLLLVLSTSFSALLYAAIVIALYPVVCRGVRARYIIAIGCCFAVLVGLLGTDRDFMRMLGLESFYERLDRTFRSLGALLTGQSATSSSEGARLTSIFVMIKILIARPFFGAGLGVTDAHSTVFAILGNIGLVGFVLWFYMLLRLGKIRKNGAFFAFMFIMSMIFTGGIGYLGDLCFPFIFVCGGIALSNKLPVKRRTQRTVHKEIVA